MAGYSPWGCQESDMTEHTHTHTHRDTHFPDAIHQKLLGWTAPTSHVNQSPSTTEKREVQNGEWKRRGVRMRGMVSYEGWGQVAQQVLTPSSLSCLTVFGGIASVKNFRQRNKDVESFALRVSWLIGWLSTPRPEQPLGRGSALSRLGAELELRRSGSSLGPSQ